MKLYLTASDGHVHLVGEGGEMMTVTPDVALELAADLPRFAAQARALAGDALTLDDMADALNKLGYVWRRELAGGRGWWEQSDREAVSSVDEYERATRRVYAEVVCGHVGPAA